LISAKGSAVSVTARLRQPAGSVRLAVRVTDPNGREIHASEHSTAAWEGPKEISAFNVPGPALWSPQTPHLYHCSVTLQSPAGEHLVEERFGFRSFEFPPHGVFHLNGEKLFLRGTQRHEDHAGLGAAMTDELIRREMQLIKDAGVNFIRLAHYQQSRQVLNLCDELGLIVWEEIPWCRGGVGGDAYKARRMLRNMIDQHRNHPSVIFWGLGNENDWPGDFATFDPQAVRGFMVELNAIAHREDSSRLTSIRRCPFAKDVPDVYSPSLWAGWYSGRYTEYKSWPVSIACCISNGVAIATPAAIPRSPTA
jgi:beta-galactosidase